MLCKQHPSRNARLATALALAALVFAAPTVAADDAPTVADDGSVTWNDCFDVNPWVVPPSIVISLVDCIPA